MFRGPACAKATARRAEVGGQKSVASDLRSLVSFCKFSFPLSAIRFPKWQNFSLSVFSVSAFPLVLLSVRERLYHNPPDQDIYSDRPFGAGVSFSSLARSDRPFRLSCVARVLASGGMLGSLCRIRGKGAASLQLGTPLAWPHR